MVVFLQRDWGKFNAGLLRSERSGERERVREDGEAHIESERLKTCEIVALWC